MKKRRLLSIVLSLCMVLALMPQMVFAENDDTTDLQGKLTAGGEVKLEKDYTIDTTLNVTKDVTLDLNGHVIKMTVGAGVIRINKSVKLTLQDSNPTAEHDDTTLPAGGVITGGSAESSGGVYVVGGEFIMDGGTIYNCRSSYNGGGVCVDGGSFTMTGGAIYDCVAQYGGGVDVSHGSFTMTGGSIFDCNADENGSAVSVNTDSIVNANGGTIKGVVHSHGCIQNTDTDGCTVFYGVIDNQGSMSGNTVTFKNEDSSYATEIVAEGNKAAKPIEPDAPEGMVFAGWYTDEALNNLYNFDMPVDDELILYAGWEEEKITLTVPFTTTVEVSGNDSPGETTFNLEVVNFQGNELQPNDYNVEITASVETDGAGDYNGNLTFTGTASAILKMFDNERDKYGYIYVKQAGVNDSNWDVDEAAWGLFHRSVVELSDEEVEPSPICIFPAVKDDTSYSVEYGENGVDKMTFVNKYASSAVDPSDSEGTTNGDSDNDSKADAEDSAKTGDDANLALWLALMLLSGAGITGVTAYTRRKRTNE